MYLLVYDNKSVSVVISIPRMEITMTVTISITAIDTMVFCVKKYIGDKTKKIISDNQKGVNLMNIY